MTVSSNVRRAGPFTGNGVTDEFPFLFTMLDADDLVVVVYDPASGETTWVQGSDYTVVLNPDQDNTPGGVVTSAAPLPTGQQLVITSNLPLSQLVIFTNAGGFYPEVLNDALDRLTIFSQQLSVEASRNLRVSVVSDANVSVEPLPLGILRWDATASKIDTVPLSDIQGQAFYATSYADVFTGDGVATEFTLTADPQVRSNMDVAVAGDVKYPGTDYDLVAGKIVFASAPANGAKILVRYQQTAILTAGVLSVAGLTGTITANDLKTNLSLNNVENKSSATIRGELTAANVRSAMGVTPFLIDVENHVTCDPIASGVLTLDLALGTSFTATWSANITSIVLANVPAVGAGKRLNWTLELVGAGGTPTFNPEAKYKTLNTEALPLSTTSGDRNVIVFSTKDGGTTVDISSPGFFRG